MPVSRSSSVHRSCIYYVSGDEDQAYSARIRSRSARQKHHAYAASDEDTASCCVHSFRSPVEIPWHRRRRRCSCLIRPQKTPHTDAMTATTGMLTQRDTELRIIIDGAMVAMTKMPHQLSTQPPHAIDGTTTLLLGHPTTPDQTFPHSSHQ